MKKVLSLIVLGIFVAIGGYLRLANLETNPNGLYVDEASTGVNAYLILLTGQDEYGKNWPIAFRFLGSYTSPLYTYLTALAIKIFGFSITSIRLVSAISGIIMIPLIFIFLKSLKTFKGNTIPLIGSLLLAISPWSVFFSRIGYEVNLAFLLYFLGVLFLWLSLRNKVYLIFAAIVLGLSLYCYQTQRFLSPLTLLVFLFIYKNTFFKPLYRRYLIISFLIFLIFLIPQLYLLATPAGLNRAKGVFYSQYLSNPYLVTREFLSQFFSFLSPRNLFFQPDSDLQRSLPELSVFYPWMMIPYLLGLFMLFKKTGYGKFVLMLLLLAPVPAALTGDPFATQRALPLALPALMVICVGINKLLEVNFKVIALAVLFLTFTSLAYLYRSYAVLLPNERAVIWGYGFGQLADEIKAKPNDQFIIDNGRIKPAYIELAFYLKIPPQNLQSAVKPDIKENYYTNVSWDSHYKLLNFETRPINWEQDIYQQLILVGDELSISETQAREHFLSKVFEIKGPLDEVIFKGFKTNPEEKLKSLLSP